MNEKENKFYYYFWLFIIGSAVGWVIEGIYSFVKYGKLINHSALVIGPFNAIYGFGAVIFTFISKKIKSKNYLVSFLCGFLGGSIIEYIASYFMELFLGFTAWNYSKSVFNINGRICLKMSLLWGLLAVAWTFLVQPLIDKLFKKFNVDKCKKITKYVIVFIVFDALLTVFAFNRARAAEKNIPASNVFEKVLDKTFNKKYLKNMYNDKWPSK